MMTSPPAAAVTSLEALNDELVIMPELFRGLVDHLTLGAGDMSLDGFLASLSAATTGSL